MNLATREGPIQWATFQQRDVEGDLIMVHVFPLFGPNHACTPFCWCHPEPGLPGVLVHNVMH